MNRFLPSHFACYVLLILAAIVFLQLETGAQAKDKFLPELLLQNAHSDRVRTVGFSPDSRVLASAGYDRVVRLWDAHKGALLRTLSGHEDRVECLAFNPEGSILASGGADRRLQLWDFSRGILLRSLKASGVIQALAFSPGGKVLAFASESDLYLLDLLGQSIERALGPKDKESGRIRALAFSPDGRRLASGGTTLKLWDPVREEKINEIPIDGAVIHGLSFNPQGTAIAAALGVSGVARAAQRPCSVTIWNTESGRLMRRLEGHRRGVLAVAYSPDGQYIASAGEDKLIRLWDAMSGAELRTLEGHSGRFGWVYSVSFSPDGRMLASAGEDATVKLWSTPEGMLLHSLEGSAAAIEAVAFSPQGTLLAAGGLGVRGDSAIWDLKGGILARPLVGPTLEIEEEIKGEAKRAAESLESLARAVEAMGAEIMSVKTEWKGERPDSPTLQRIMVGLSGTLRPTIFSPDGKCLLSGTLHRYVRIWQPATGNLLASVLAHNGLVKSLAFSQDGRIFATGGDDKAIKIWDTANLSLLQKMPNAHSEPVAALDFSPDGSLMASLGGQDLKVFDTANWALRKTIHVGTGFIIAFSPDQLMVATADKDVDLWDPKSGRQLRTIKAESRGINALDFSPDGKTIAIGTAERTIGLFDLTDGALINKLSGHSGPVWSVAFSPDGRFLASGSDDSTVKFWNPSTGELLATVASFYDGREWLVTVPDGLFDGSPGAFSRVRWRFSQNLFDTASAEVFFSEFYYPGLLADVLSGKRPKAPRDFAKIDRRQPEVKLALGAQPAPEGPITSRTVILNLEVAEASWDAKYPTGSGARDVRLFRNGSLVKVWRGNVLRGQAKATLKADLPIVAGPNHFTAYAFNKDNIKSPNAGLVVMGAESLRRKGTAYVLAVGINQYDNKDYSLKYAISDAQAFVEELSRQLTNLGEYARVEAIPLFDKEAIKSNILAAFKRLAGEATSANGSLPAALNRLTPAQPEDAIFVYFAGHGTASGPRFYLIPYDLGYSGSRTEIDKAGLTAILEHSISDRDLEQAFEKIDAGRLLLVIDACNSGQALEAEEKRRGPMNSRGLAQLAYEKGMYVLTAAQGYQASLEAAQLGHGYLTYALVEEGLKTASADSSPKDGSVVVREWLDYATLRVPQMQELGMEDARKLGRNLAILEGEEKIDDPAKRSLQRPRVFYRREPEAVLFIVAKPPAIHEQ